jgi:quinolinate synthase
MGFGPEEMLLWDTRYPPEDEALGSARVLLWPGACNEHQRFRPEHVHAVRGLLPGVRVIVHPESPVEVADLADEAGSTALIISEVESAPPGTRWAIGTEARLVHRLQAQHPEQQILSLAHVPPFCRTMSQVRLENLAEVLEALVEGNTLNQVEVEGDTASWARIALERMLAL